MRWTSEVEKVSHPNLKRPTSKATPRPNLAANESTVSLLHSQKHVFLPTAPAYIDTINIKKENLLMKSSGSGP